MVGLKRCRKALCGYLPLTGRDRNDMTEAEFYKELSRVVEAGTPAALATVIEAGGSTPRKAGAKMLVLADGTSLGTVGGGRPEAETIEAARGIIGGADTRTLSFILTEEHGYVCGGSAKVFIEPLNSRPRLILFGAGHVGRALAPLAAGCGFRVSVVDDRPECATTELLPGAAEVICSPMAEALDNMAVDDATFILVVTKGHVSDFAVVRRALRTPAAFIGLVGSRRKREALFGELRAEGVAERDLERIVSPVGIAIGAETPEEIAVSIVAQLIERTRCPAGSAA